MARVHRGAGQSRKASGLGEAVPSSCPWQRQFLRGIAGTEGDAALTVARGNGKTALLAGIALAHSRWPVFAIPRSEKLFSAASSFFSRPKSDLAHAKAMLGVQGRGLEATAQNGGSIDSLSGERRFEHLFPIGRKVFEFWDAIRAARMESRPALVVCR